MIYARTIHTSTIANLTKKTYRVICSTTFQSRTIYKVHFTSAPLPVVLHKHLYPEHHPPVEICHEDQKYIQTAV